MSKTFIALFLGLGILLGLCELGLAVYQMANGGELLFPAWQQYSANALTLVLILAGIRLSKSHSHAQRF